MAQKLVDVDYDRNMALVVLEAGKYNDRIIAIGRYAGNPTDDSVEISFVVHEDFQGRGIKEIR